MHQKKHAMQTATISKSSAFQIIEKKRCPSHQGKKNAKKKGSLVKESKENGTTQKAGSTLN